MELSGWIGTVVAICGAIFTYGQIKLRQQEVQFQLYEKRMDVYILVYDFILRIRGIGGVDTINDIYDFRHELRKGKLLFPKKIRNDIEMIEKKAFRIWSANEDLKSPSEGEKREKQVAERRAIFDEIDVMGKMLIEDMEKEISPTDIVFMKLLPRLAWWKK
ncbi:MAG: hypothetical protein KQJ78_07870 [Deltaproteobacteria bacterium]|nr:hypothetical protein [Deltaproteobacteria bacterium]MCB2186319.1 hypothetical protein [Deltaproteobacteria bacterium]